MNPTEFDGINLKLQDKNNYNKWSEFQLTVDEMPKNLFKNGLVDKTSEHEYLVGYEKHMLYVEKMEDGGKILSCMNSAGKYGDRLNLPKPTIFTDRVDDEDIAFFAIKLKQHDTCMYNIISM